MSFMRRLIPAKRRLQSRRHLGAGIVAGLVIGLYPLLVYIGVSTVSIRFTASGLAFVILFRLLAGSATQGRSPFKLAGLLICLGGFTLSIAGMLGNNLLFIKLYPFLVNLIMLTLFAWSLWHPPSIIERLARLQTAELPEQAITYTRKVTVTWCLFFIGNGLIALLTALCAPLAIWSLYNGLIAYVLIGLLFGIEWLIRRRVHNRHSLL